MFEKAKNEINENIVPGKNAGTSATGLKKTLLTVLEDARDAIADTDFGILGSITTTQDLNVLNSFPDGVYEAQTAGVYKNGLTAKEGYYTRFRKTANVWQLESETKVPAYDDTPLKQRVTNTEKKVDDFIRDFSVTTDTEFNAESKNPIANSAVTPLADALSSFLESDKVVVNTTDSKLGYIKNDGTIVVGNENKYIEITDLASFKYLNYEGYKAVANTNSQGAYSSVLAVKSDGSKETLLGMFNVSKGQGAQVKESFNILIPENTTKLLIGWSVWGIAEDIRLSFSNEKDSVKKFIESSVRPLNEILNSFLKPVDFVNIPTNNNEFGHIKTDGSFLLGDSSAKLIKNIDTSSFDNLYFKGYKSVVSQENVPNFCSIIGVKNNGSKRVILGSAAVQLSQTIVEQTFDLTNVNSISISYGNYGASLNQHPIIRLYNSDGEIDTTDLVAKRTVPSFKKSSFAYVDLTKNYFHPEKEITSNFEFKISSIGNFGNMNVFKLKGASISFSGNFEMANNSSTYDATKYNTIYIYNEYDVAKVYIEN